MNDLTNTVTDMSVAKKIWRFMADAWFVATLLVAWISLCMWPVSEWGWSADVMGGIAIFPIGVFLLLAVIGQILIWREHLNL